MNPDLIVTGIDGFVGRHVARLADASGYRVIGIGRAPSVDSEVDDSLADYVQADLTKAWPATLPTDASVIHLAGLAAVGASFASPQRYISDNSAMVTNMCEALVAAGSRSRILGVSTGAVYRNVDDSARSEDGPVDVTSPYVVSKLLVESQLAYYQRRGLDTVIARPFNHFGPGQGSGFLVPDLIDQLIGMDAGARLRVGDLGTSRDYTDVRDVANAYLSLIGADRLAHRIYNIASGVPRSGRDVLEALCSELAMRRPELEIDTSRMRANDPRLIVGDATRLRSDTDWRPRIPFEETIRDAVDARKGQPRRRG